MHWGVGHIAAKILGMAAALMSAAVLACLCDVDGDLDIERDDLVSIQQAVLARATPTGPGDPRDGDQNGAINSSDGRVCALRCTRPGCASNAAPFADAGSDQTTALGQRVQLNGRGSTDTEGDRLTYLWVLSARP